MLRCRSNTETHMQSIMLSTHTHAVPPPLELTDEEMVEAVARETDAVLSVCCLVSRLRF